MFRIKAKAGGNDKVIDFHFANVGKVSLLLDFMFKHFGIEKMDEQVEG